ncbi:MAG: NAD-glutamate dehydrogenase [Caulobacteraceae bacterium]|nr:NAD-glutamate dehydrogenase [Caulobacteraceae bacterium]
MHDDGAPTKNPPPKLERFSPEVIGQALAKAKGKACTAAERDFVRQLADDYAPDDLPQLSAADLGALALELWSFCNVPALAEPRIRIVEARGQGGRPLKLDLLQIVQVDRPFLVDSVMGELVSQGLTIRAMLHPVIAPPGGKAGPPRSVICVLVEPLDDRQKAALVAGLEAVLADVYAAVEDFPAMLGLMGRTLAELERTAPAGSHKAEALALLRWLEADRFVFLGARIYEYPLTKTGRYAHEEPLFEIERSLGILRDPNRGVLRRDNEPAVLTSQLRSMIEADNPLVVAKANICSRVHRRVYMDYVGIKRYGPDGRPVGEVRFVGLFTAEAYDEPVRQVPLVREKVANVLARADKAQGSHDQRRLQNVLETYPRDELFQIPEDELLHIALGVVHLYDRPRLRLFVRKDPFDRFVSILLYVPRDRFDAALAERAGDILAEAWGGRLSAHYPSFSEMPLARTHYIIGLTPGDHREPQIEAVEAQIAAAARTWQDRFDEILRQADDRHLAADLRARYDGAFPPGYQDQFTPEEALADLKVIETMSPDRPVQVRAYRTEGDHKDSFRFKLYRFDEAAPLSDVLPIVESMGLKALVEHGFRLKPQGAGGRRPVWVHEFVLRRGAHETLDDLAHVKAPFEEAFIAIWCGLTENDGFNRLVLELGIPWREAALIRALARYRQQTGLDPSQGVQEEALADNPAVTHLILVMFHAKFDPGLKSDLKARQTREEALFARIQEALQAVVSLDEDRVLRRLALLVRATVRTSYFQTAADGGAKPYISFKIASRELADLPAPKPYREIFIWSPQVEGVHLRFGPVARGGLRWSDRRDDFRTEVLGLAKAQQVKNAVIVPVGAKGGFYPKKLPKGGTQDAIREEGVSAYKTFLSGLLDITDNLDAKGEVIPPRDVVRHDGDDPYLVVAADKGTATFSDIANDMAQQYGFWLGDAFASGGSAGYDHKAMGITARGAWEAIKRHFRELGKDIQATPFTCIGIGDMSGDVFGNGMLLSRQTKLLAAFDHRHVFLDPDPDPAKSWAERKRMFALPRSSWADYNAGLISKGGGVYPRSAKSIPLSRQVKALLEVDDDELPPADLIRAILKAKAELLYLGGIGTYVKAPGQSNADVGDKANDAVRIDATELRVTVVGEGANLGVTQAGRIAYARAGGRIDTDAIDNSAGVDTSDHEVNIKILTSALETSGKLTRAARDKLLQSMTEEVAAHVLAHNHDQTLALSLLERTAPAELDNHARFMAELVAAGRLDRVVEGLPGPVAIAELAKAGKGLTRPELAVLLAYGKLELAADIVASAAPDDPFFEGALEGYFPTALRPYREAMRRHRLRREIIATVQANAIVDITGPTFASRLKAASGCDTRGLVIAFEAAWRVFRLEETWAAITALDDTGVPAEAQLSLYQEVALTLRRQTYWLARRALSGETSVQSLVEAYRPAADTLRAQGLSLMSALEQGAVQSRVDAFVEAGAPRDLAASIGALRPLTSTSDVADLARAVGWDLLAAGRIYHQTGAVFGFDRLRAAAGGLPATDAYERQAVRQLIEDLLSEQAAMVRSIMASAERDTGCGTVEEAREAVEAWGRSRPAAVEAVASLVRDIENSGDGWSFARLTIVNSAMRQLAATAQAVM